MRRPIFLLVSSDATRLEALRYDLSRRYEADYEVLAADSAAAGLAVLAERVRAADAVALIIADEHLPDMAAADFLIRAHDLHRDAKRVMLIDRGYWSAGHPAISALAVGKIDYHLYAPWRPPERFLYPALSE